MQKLFYEEMVPGGPGPRVEEWNMEKSGHLERITLVALSEGRLPRSGRLRAARHLEACPSCKQELGRLLRPGESPQGRLLCWPSRQPAYGEAFRRVFERLPDLLDRLHEEVSNDRLPLHDSGDSELSRRRPDRPWIRRRGPLARCNLLLEGCVNAVAERPERARLLAERAIEVAGDQLPDSPWAALLRDVQARAWAYLGHLHQLQGDPAAAEAAFAQADACLLRGTGDPLEEAHVLRLEALWAESRGDVEEAEWLLHREADLYRRAQSSRSRRRAL